MLAYWWFRNFTSADGCFWHSNSKWKGLLGGPTIPNTGKEHISSCVNQLSLLPMTKAANANLNHVTMMGWILVNSFNERLNCYHCFDWRLTIQINCKFKKQLAWFCFKTVSVIGFLWVQPNVRPTIVGHWPSMLLLQDQWITGPYWLRADMKTRQWHSATGTTLTTFNDDTNDYWYQDRRVGLKISD
jgi:hypothetical protein